MCGGGVEKKINLNDYIHSVCSTKRLMHLTNCSVDRVTLYLVFFFFFRWSFFSVCTPMQKKIKFLEIFFFLLPPDTQTQRTIQGREEKKKKKKKCFLRRLMMALFIFSVRVCVGGWFFQSFDLVRPGGGSSQTFLTSLTNSHIHTQVKKKKGTFFLLLFMGGVTREEDTHIVT